MRSANIATLRRAVIQSPVVPASSRPKRPFRLSFRLGGVTRPPALISRGGYQVIEPSHAVFLSYASQDAPAAQRICEALRAAGIEVWYDQSELRGGDAWDRKIRREIHDCALFLPLI